MSFFYQIISIFLLMSAGWVLRRRKLVDDLFTRRLSTVLFNVFYPCLILSAILSRFTLHTLVANWTLPAGVFLIKLIGWLIGGLSLRLWHGSDPATNRTFHFTCAVNNYSFLPIMLVQPLWGDEAVAFVAFGSLGAEIFVWTLGIRTLAGHQPGSRLKHLLSMPMLALAAAFLLLAGKALIPLTPPTALQDTGAMLWRTLKTAGQATIPVSALICGARIGGLHIGKSLTLPAWFFSFLRLLLIPAAAIALLAFLPVTPEARRVLMVIAVQPAAMASVSLAEVYGGDANFAATAVFLTHILCLATIPLWLLCLGVA